MSSFWNLVGFEYKKMLMRRGVIIALALLFALTLISPAMELVGTSYADGKPWETHYDAMIKDRAHQRALTGRPVDAALFREMQDAYSKLPPVERYTLTPEYEQHARRYSEVFWILRSVYRNLEMDSVLNLTTEELENFYEVRRESLAARLDAINMSEGAKAWVMESDSEISTPWVFGYTGGYHRFLVLTITGGLFAALALAVCLAPLFAGEYTTGASQLILSSRYGKSKVIAAKLFTAATFSTVVSVLVLSITWLLCGLLLGFDGAGVLLQVDGSPFVAYPFTMAGAAGVLTVGIILASLLTTALTVLLSSKFGTPFGVIVIVGLVLIIPIFVTMSDNVALIYNIYSLLPTNIMALNTLLSYVPYDIFGVCIPPYVFLPVFAGLVSALLLPLAGRVFREHQIG